MYGYQKYAIDYTILYSYKNQHKIELFFTYKKQVIKLSKFYIK